MAHPPTKIASLDGLRGIAAVYVMVYHYQLHQQLGVAPLMTALDHGYLAVDLFFVLSGYVMTLADGASLAGGSRAAVGRFLVRRLARIYPLYLASTLLAHAVAMALGRPEVDLVTGLANLLMVQAWGIGASINGATWSLSAEWAAYLLFPRLCRLGASPRGPALQIGLGVAATVLVASPLASQIGAPGNGPLDVTAPGTPWPVVRCLGEFLIGCGLRGLRFQPGAAAGGVGDAAAALAVLGLFVPGADLLFVAATAVVIACLPCGHGVAGRLLSNGPVVWLGERSLSIYLLHTAVFPVEARLADWLPLPHGLARAATLAACYAGVIAGSHVTHRWIEGPGRRAVRRLLGAGRTGAAAMA